MHCCGHHAFENGLRSASSALAPVGAPDMPSRSLHQTQLPTTSNRAVGSPDFIQFKILYLAEASQRCLRGHAVA